MGRAVGTAPGTDRHLAKALAAAGTSRLPAQQSSASAAESLGCSGRVQAHHGPVQPLPTMRSHGTQHRQDRPVRHMPSASFSHKHLLCLIGLEPPQAPCGTPAAASQPLSRQHHVPQILGLFSRLHLSNMRKPRFT